MNDLQNYYKNLKSLGVPLWIDAQQSKEYIETLQNKSKNNPTLKPTTISAQQELNVLINKFSINTDNFAQKNQKISATLNEQESFKNIAKPVNNTHTTHNNNSVETFSIKLKLIHYTQAQILLLFESSNTNTSINQIELLKLADNLIFKLNFNIEKKIINFNWPFNEKFLASKNEFIASFSTFSKQLIEKNSIKHLIIFGQKMKNQLQTINLDKKLTILDDLPDFELLLNQKQLRIGVWKKLSVLQKN